nr:hypothetical protein [Tanacetum cinerariifolium]
SRGAGFCWGMMVEVRGSSGKWWKLSRNIGKGVAGHCGKYGWSNSSFKSWGVTGK